MKCLRIYATPDGESHFGEVDIPMTAKLTVAPGAKPFQVSQRYPASSMEVTQIPAGMRQVEWHTVPARVLTVRLTGAVDTRRATARCGASLRASSCWWRTHTERAICLVIPQTSKPFFGSGYPAASICRPHSSQGSPSPTTPKICKWAHRRQGGPRLLSASAPKRTSTIDAGKPAGDHGRYASVGDGCNPKSSRGAEREAMARLGIAPHRVEQRPRRNRRRLRQDVGWVELLRNPSPPARRCSARVIL